MRSDCWPGVLEPLSMPWKQGPALITTTSFASVWTNTQSSMTECSSTRKKEAHEATCVQLKMQRKQENKWTHRQAKDDGCFDELPPAPGKGFSIHASECQ